MLQCDQTEEEEEYAEPLPSQRVADGGIATGILGGMGFRGRSGKGDRVCEPERDLRYQRQAHSSALRVGAISVKQGGTAGYSPVPAKKYLLGRAFLFLSNKRENGNICLQGIKMTAMAGKGG